MDISLKMTSLVFFLATVLLLQTVTFSPLTYAQTTNEDIQIPSWFKNNVKWWNEDKLSDEDIVNAIDYLLNHRSIKLDLNEISGTLSTPESSSSQSQTNENNGISSDVKDIFVLWQKGSVSDSDVANAIKFLIEANIITAASPSIDKQPKKLAAIIDQLHKDIPNIVFQQKVQQYLEIAGYEVDVYTTEDITVDFYKKLPSMNYKFIVIRTHSLEDPEFENATFLFTGERYNGNKHINEQLSGQISRGWPLTEQQFTGLEETDDLISHTMYFLVGPKLIDELMEGEFPKSVIVIGGCESVRNKDLANSLISRGASSVIGWDATISAYDNDRVLLALLEDILVNKILVRDSISSVMQEFGPTLQYQSQLLYVHR